MAGFDPFSPSDDSTTEAVLDAQSWLVPSFTDDRVAEIRSTLSAIEERDRETVDTVESVRPFRKSGRTGAGI